MTVLRSSPTIRNGDFSLQLRQLAFLGREVLEGKPAIISNGKLRVSYGALGNSNVKPYSYLEKFTLKTYSTTGSSSEGRYLDGKAQLRYTLNPAQIP